MGTVTPAKVTWTYDDLQLMPDDGRRYEVIDGALHVTPAPTTIHQRVSRRIQFVLMQQLEVTEKAEVFNAPVDVFFDDTSVVQPDLALIAWERRNFITPRSIATAPDVVVEILSPSTSPRDRTIKAKLYGERGVPEYWLVDTERKHIEVFVLGGEGYELMATYGPGDTVRSTRFEIDLPIDPVFA